MGPGWLQMGTDLWNMSGHSGRQLAAILIFSGSVQIYREPKNGLRNDRLSRFLVILHSEVYILFWCSLKKIPYTPSAKSERTLLTFNYVDLRGTPSHHFFTEIKNSNARLGWGFPTSLLLKIATNGEKHRVQKRAKPRGNPR